MLYEPTRFLVCLSLFLAIGPALALSPNERLLRMVPPGASLVAGFRAPETGMTRYFMILTKWNRLDLDDFIALTGADQTRRLHEAMFVSGSSDEEKWSAHTLLVQGTFDVPAVLRFADGVKVRRHSYRDLPVLLVQPFERERKYLKEVRWLALLDSNFAVFGTPEAVQEEVDRDLDRSSTDPKLIFRLSRLSNKDGTWSIVTNTELTGMMLPSIRMIDPKLGKLVENCRSVQLGFEVGTRVRMEYEIGHAQVESPLDITTASDPPAGAESFLGSHRLSATKASEATSQGVLKFSRDRYERWLDEIKALGRK